MSEVPGLKPVTTPDASMVATVVLVLAHIPPDVIDESVLVIPGQLVSVVVPVIGSTTGGTQGAGVVIMLLTVPVTPDAASQLHLVYMVIAVAP